MNNYFEINVCLKGNVFTKKIKFDDNKNFIEIWNMFEHQIKGNLFGEIINELKK